MNDTKTAYICLTDWDYELDEAPDGTRLYPTLDAIKAHRACATECGVAEVKVAFSRAVLEPLDPLKRV